MDKNPTSAPQTEPAAPATESAAPVTFAAPKKKKGPAIVISAAVIAALGGAGAAAYFIINNNNAGSADNQLTNAIVGLFNGNTKNIKIDGSLVSDTFGKMTVSAVASQNASKATVGIDANGATISADIALSEKDLYAKINNLSDLLANYGIPSSMSSLFSSYNNQWYHASAEDLAGMASATSVDPTDAITCLTSFQSDKLSTLGDFYKEDPFLTATLYEGNDIEKKNSDLYSIAINNQKVKAFGEKIENSADFSETVSCIKSLVKDNKTTSSKEETTVIPGYFEFKDSHISRFYLKDDSIRGTFDVSLEYPNEVTIDLPTEYKEFSDLLEGFGLQSIGLPVEPSIIKEDDDDDIDWDNFTSALKDVDSDKYKDSFDVIDWDELEKSLNEIDYEDLKNL